MVGRRGSARALIGSTVVVGAVLLWVRWLERLTSTPAPGEGAGFSLTFLLAQLAFLIGIFYLSVGGVLATWYCLTTRQYGWWHRYSEPLTLLGVSIGVPAITVGVLFLAGYGSDLPILFVASFVGTLPVDIGLLSTGRSRSELLAAAGGLTYMLSVLLWLVTRPNESIVMALGYPVLFVVAFYFLCGPLYVVSANVGHTADGRTGANRTRE